MITLGILYLVVATISCFTALVISRVYDWRDEAAIVFYPAGMFVAWPVMIPLTLLVFMILGMNDVADQAARRIKNRRS